MSINPSTITAAIAALKPATGGVYTLEPFENCLKLKLGHGSNGSFVFLGQTDTKQTAVFIEGPKAAFDTLPISSSIKWAQWNRHAGGKFGALMVSDLPAHLHHLLNNLIVNLATKLENATSKLSPIDLCDVVEQSLSSEIESGGLMSNSSRIGLFGELILLRHLINSTKPSDYTDVLNLWTGPNLGERDFKTKDGFVEVKTSGTKRTHQINDHEQLHLKGKEAKGFLFSVIAKSDDSGNIHLVDLINDLRKELKKGHCDALFEKKLENYGGTGEGYFPELEPAYRRTKKYLHDPNDDGFFELNDDYRLPKMKPLKLPRFVTIGQYELDLKSARKANLSNTVSWMLK
jgi:hypothetical protein